MSTLKVNTIRHTGASSDAITLASDGTAAIGECTAKITNNLSNRNLIINGAMNVAQRGTSQTGSAANGYATVDRFSATQSGTDNYIEQHQVDVSSGTTPYTKGFRKAFQVKNGNQSSGAGAADYIRIFTALEGQDIANSGWDYTSTSSYITLSFWVKSSVAQNFYGFIRSTDGTMQQYPFETGSLSANTWTKVTKTIPGNSNLTFNNDTGGAFELWIHQYTGTNETASGVSLHTWAAYSGTAKMPDNTSTWYTTDDATFEITGVQLEVGDVATDFEHRSYGDELARCQRYYYFHVGGPNTWSNASTSPVICLFHMWNTGSAFGYIDFPVSMRTSPSADFNLGTDRIKCESAGTTDYCNVITINSTQTHPNATRPYIYGDLSYTAGNAGLAFLNNNDAYVAFTAEL